MEIREVGSIAIDVLLADFPDPITDGRSRRRIAFTANQKGKGGGAIVSFQLVGIDRGDVISSRVAHLRQAGKNPNRHEPD